MSVLRVDVRYRARDVLLDGDLLRESILEDMKGDNCK